MRSFILLLCVSCLLIGSDALVLKRTLYLISCPDQICVDSYRTIVPSLTSDVVFLCWKEACSYVWDDAIWPQMGIMVPAFESNNKLTTYLPYIRNHDSFSSDHHFVYSNVWVYNTEGRQGASWATHRNELYTYATTLDRTWAYMTFLDGNTRIECPYLHSTLRYDPQHPLHHSLSFSLDQIRHVIPHYPLLYPESMCFLFYDLFLLHVRPAVGTIASTYKRAFFPGEIIHTGYALDHHTLNSFHHDVLPFVMPYCTRYGVDYSQMFMVYRLECVYSHVLWFHLVEHEQEYVLKSWQAFDALLIKDNNNLIEYIHTTFERQAAHYWMRSHDAIAPVLFDSYPGFSPSFLSKECRSTRIESSLTCNLTTNPYSIDWTA